MAAETVLVSDLLMNYKQLMLAFGGFVVRLMWMWEKPIKWLRIIAGLVFLFGALYFNEKHTPHDYRDVVAALIGLFTNNIITTLFTWYSVNEDALMHKKKRWWYGDNKPGSE